DYFCQVWDRSSDGLF
nr:immunoglobulin light chain junction region [Macaca mulatta]